MLLTVALLAGGSGVVWGQEVSVTYPTDMSQVGQSTEVIYAKKGRVTIVFQEYAGSNLNGYMFWYVLDGNTQTATGLSHNDLTACTNGYLWLRERDGDIPSADESKIWYDYDGTSEVTIVCEASSLNNVTEGNDQITLPLVTLKRTYIIKPASARSAELSDKKTALENAHQNWRTIPAAFLALVKDMNEKASSSSYFIDKYEVHTPITGKTNFRLSEKLTNFFYNNTQASSIRWSFFDVNGNQKATATTSGAKGHIMELVSVADKLGISASSKNIQRGYIVAEAQIGSGYYPISFISVYMEPYSEPLTEEELTTKINAATTDREKMEYTHRQKDYLLENKYREIGSVTFDGPNNGVGDAAEQDVMNFSAVTASDNYRTEPLLNADSYYGFAYPSLYADRNNNSGSVGRGEYALYRTLNYSVSNKNLSKGNVSLGNRQTITYNDYFTGNDIYNKYVVDRKYDNTKGVQSGYFLYLDAADEPGVITKITLQDQKLCSNTRLVFTAWVCDLSAENVNNNQDALRHADVGFTLKGKQGETETILTKYYSGALELKPAQHRQGTSNVYEQAQWQQIYFTFSFTGNVEYDSYILEIANNSSSSAGADYAIDDISVLVSTPGISVDRKDACTSSLLNVYSNYRTLLDNMDWDEDQNVLTETAEELKKEEAVKIRKYRYGLMGNDPDGQLVNMTRTKGNVYFAFFDEKNWIPANKELLESGNNVLKNLSVPVRVVVDTDFDGMPKGQEAAALEEIRVNLQAILDYNADNNRNTNEGYEVADYWPDNDTIGVNPSEYGITETIQETAYAEKIAAKVFAEPAKYAEQYKTLIERLYAIIGIPRARVAWRGKGTDDAETIYLTNIDVANTDLKYVGEPVLGQDGQPTGEKYTGKYNVILFSGRQIAESEDASKEFDISYISNNDCALKEEFLVKASTTIAIQTMMDTETAICSGALRKITASLNAYDKTANKQLTKEELDQLGISYVLDWYMGPRVGGYDDIAIEYDNTSHSLKEALSYFRENYSSSNAFTGEITTEMLDSWINSGDNTKSAIATKLKELVNAGDLRTGTQPEGVFEAYIESAQIVVLPYVYGTGDVDDIDICQEEANVDINISSDHTPTITPGIPNVNLNNHVSALRLGERHLAKDVRLTIPVNDAEHHAEADALGLVEDGENPVLMQDMTQVGEVTELSISKKEGTLTAELTIKWNEVAAQKLVEGTTYELLIPFVQHKDGVVLNSLCDGLAHLWVKVVPEYLTWDGSGSDKWYDDSKWKKSNNGELFMGDKSAEADANGTGTLDGAFSPLYFSKITLLGNETEDKQLVLESVEKNTDGTLKIADNEIIYDMAVTSDPENSSIAEKTIKPYYINEVSEIYFKPEAILMNQHFLTYDTARVEFEMTQGAPYWMSSPLKDTYAGDMYAPSDNGKQETPAFEYITYDKDKNSRWGLPFYQKAWDKEIAYSTDENGSASTSVKAVKSNWSIEYNDVWVPYSLGKGFYARVEKNNATVRLPKADTEYSYENATTKADLSPKPTDRGGAGKLAGNENVTVSLTDGADGDGDHFLVGNPYMSYLDMNEFFTENSGLNKKYWILSNGESKAVVGTPDVAWTGNETASETISGFIPPMTAFFVERAGYTETTKAGEEGTALSEIVFTTDMMATKPSTGGATTRAVAASNPALTLTAERGDAKSRALLTTRDNADNGYKADEDAVVLLDSELAVPMVYTVSGSRAAQVNAVREIKNVGLGVYGEGNEEVTLTIEGLSRLANPLYLYDAQTRESVRLEGDSYSLTLTGESHGRYFLRDAAPGSELENTILIYSVRRGEVIVSALHPVTDIKVFGLNGAQARQFSVNTTRYRFDLPAGIYVVYASDGETEHTEKVIVR